ncbi:MULTISPECIES: DUF488 domain-containing protein [Rhodococcus]|uniref:Uncharacterized conserved protein YeaO, DUF488 family n=1 Tax=Rhodococcus maanshanensis TaxID=183556 RepID=A0A1H7PGW2_9NOCA|nr:MULTISPECIES: DUF488 family protein [Rhodococcus]SEL35010.1 Uncharacterized conserved protein YeaO, DUF488 family [Rhodococcus maanshanensis]
MSRQTKPTVTIERVYDHPEPEPGARIFVDRLWPRGIRKDAFHYDDWARDLAPSTELRRWYSHEAAHFREFRARYRAELESDAGQEAIARVEKLAHGRPLVLLTATRDLEHSHAEVLAEFLRGSDS